MPEVCKLLQEPIPAQIWARILTLKIDGENETNFARRAGIPLSTLREWQYRIPKESTLRTFCETLGISPLWIRNGIGPKTIKETEEWFEEWRQRQALTRSA